MGPLLPLTWAQSCGWTADPPGLSLRAARGLPSGRVLRRRESCGSDASHLSLCRPAGFSLPAPARAPSPRVFAAQATRSSRPTSRGLGPQPGLAPRWSEKWALDPR